MSASVSCTSRPIILIMSFYSSLALCVFVFSIPPSFSFSALLPVACQLLFSFFPFFLFLTLFLVLPLPSSFLAAFFPLSLLLVTHFCSLPHWPLRQHCRAYHVRVKRQHLCDGVHSEISAATRGNRGAKSYLGLFLPSAPFSLFISL